MLILMRFIKKYLIRPCIASEYNPADHFYAAFGHLTGYGARYYGYMWSKVFAHDLFHAIKKKAYLILKLAADMLMR